MQGGRNSQRCRGLARNIAATRSRCAAPSSADLLSSSPNRGTLLGALDDPGNALRVERGIAGQSLHERLAVTFAEPIEQLATCSGRSGRPEFGAKGDVPQGRQPA